MNQQVDRQVPRKTSDLIGPALDWAVAKCEGGIYQGPSVRNSFWMWPGEPARYSKQAPSYSTDWAQGGPIIEREGINVRAIRKEGHALNGQWLAAYDHGNTGTLVKWVKRTDFPKHYFPGSTPLIAAMRCLVASKLGECVEIPESLLSEGTV